jgi:hypothetical protein
VTTFGAADASKYNALMRDVTAYLGAVPQVFVHDGALGAAASADAPMRVICDNAVSALAVAQLLHRVPLRAPEAFPRAARVYVAAGMQGSASGVFFNPKTRVAAVVGTTALQSVVDALTVAGAAGLAQQHSVNALVAAGGVKGRQLVLGADVPAFHHVVVGKDGVSAAWRGSWAADKDAAVLSDGVLAVGVSAAAKARPNVLGGFSSLLFVHPSAAAEAAKVDAVSEETVAGLVALVQPQASYEQVVQAARVLLAEKPAVVAVARSADADAEKAGSAAGAKAVLEAAAAQLAKIKPAPKPAEEPKK